MISFIVPAYNEAERIGATIATILAVSEQLGVRPIDIVVVNDGSTDRTGEVLAELARKHDCIQVLENETNLGLGTAIKKGIAAVKYDRFVFVPGDNQMMEFMLRSLIVYRDAADLVFAWRINVDARSILRNILSSQYNMFCMLCFGAMINHVNATCVYPTERVRALRLRGRRFSIAAELNLKLLRSGGTYCEIPGYDHPSDRIWRTLSLKNFVEIVGSFLWLLFDIHIAGRQTFNKVPQRVFIDFATPALGGPVGRVVEMQAMRKDLSVSERDTRARVHSKK